MSKVYTLPETFNKYFKDRYKSYDTFYCRAIRHKKLKSFKQGKRLFIKESSIKKYFEKEKQFEQKCSYWIEVLSSVKNKGKITEVQKIIGLNNPTCLYSVILNNSIGKKLIDKLSDNEDKILEISDYISDNILPQDIKRIRQFNSNNPYGLSHREIAKKLGINRGKVWNIEESALKKIRAYIIKENLSPALLDYFVN